MIWFENIDGRGTFSDAQTFINRGSTRFIISMDSDIDLDGDADFVSFGREGTFDLAWHERRVLGDSNGDGVFDSSDLVKAFQSGEYEDHVDGNSNFDEGDWNGDGNFDSADFVAALEAGTYRDR